MSATLSARANLDLLDAQYAAWKQSPESVDAQWQAFFEGFEIGIERLAREAPATSPKQGKGAVLSEEALSFRMKVTEAVMRFRSLGHAAAWLDPLSKAAPVVQALTLEALGFADSELEGDVATQFFRKGQRMKLRAMLDDLRRIYCDRMGFEVMHIHKPEVRTWLLDRIEARIDSPPPTREEQVQALRWLLEPETFERFLHKRFVGQKRFSIEGGDALMVSLQALLEELPQRGGQEIVADSACWPIFSRSR